MEDPHPTIQHSTIQAGSIPEGGDVRMIVDDTMVQSLPYASVVFLVNNDGHYGSGVFLQNKDTRGSKCIITCAHNFVFSFGNQYREYFSNKQDWGCYYGKYKVSELSLQTSKLTPPQFKLKIKGVNIHPKYYGLRTGATKAENPKFADDPNHPIDTKSNIFPQTPYDVAVIELVDQIDVEGFYISKEPIKLSQLTFGQKQTIELSGFPVTKDTMGVMYTEILKGKLEGKKPEDIIYDLNNGKDYVLRHRISSLPGNSGSPIYFNRNYQPTILGIHTTGVGFDKDKNPALLGEHDFNNATDIYSPEVFDWLKSLPCLKSFFK